MHMQRAMDVADVEEMMLIIIFGTLLLASAVSISSVLVEYSVPVTVWNVARVMFALGANLIGGVLFAFILKG